MKQSDNRLGVRALLSLSSSLSCHGLVHSLLLSLSLQFSQIVQILNAHTESLNWIDRETSLLKQKVEDVGKLAVGRKKEQEKSFRTVSESGNHSQSCHWVFVQPATPSSHTHHTHTCTTHTHMHHTHMHHTHTIHTCTTHTHACTHTHMHTHACTHMHAHMCMYIYIYAYALSIEYIHSCTCLCACLT